MKLRVYQQGGGLIYTPFIPEQGGIPTPKSAKSDEDEAKIDPLDKEILALMKDENLLPSDIQAISNALISFQRSTQHLSDTAGFGGTGAYRSVMPGMLQIMNMVSTAKFNKGQWDNAVKEMQKHDAGSEVAMNSYGRMYVMDSNGKLTTVSPSEFDPEKHSPISNSQLLQIRERSAGMDGQLLNSMDDLVGKQDVYKAINEIIKAYGTDENAQLLSKDKAVQNVLIDINSPDGIYKLTTKYPQADLQKAFKTLYDELPTNMQNLLKANAALSGEKNPTEGAYKFIHSIIMNNINTSKIPTYDATASKAAGAGSGSDSRSKVQDTYAEHLMNDPFTSAQYTRIQPGASNVPLYAYVQDAGPILQHDGKTRFDSANLTEIMKHANAIGAIVDAENIAFGDQRVNNTQWSEIVYDNSSNMQRVWLPTRQLPDGHYVPDLKAVSELNEINDAIKTKFGEMPNQTAINEWLRDHNIVGHYDSDKKMVIFDRSVMRPYLAVKAYTDKNSNVIKDSAYYKDITGEPDANAIKDMYNNAAQKGYSNSASSKEKYDNRTTHAKHNIYSGVLYMPLAETGVATSIFNTERFPVEDYMNIAGQAQEHYREQQIQDSMTLNW